MTALYTRLLQSLRNVFDWFRRKPQIEETTHTVFIERPPAGTKWTEGTFAWRIQKSTVQAGEPLGDGADTDVAPGLRKKE